MTSILALKPGQFSQVTGRSPVTLASDRNRTGHAVYAWGANEPALGKLTFMDAVAVLLVERLAVGLERVHCASIVRVFAHYWMPACARIEHDDPTIRGEDVFFAVSIVDPDKGIMRADALLGSEMPKLLELIAPHRTKNFQLIRVDLRELMQLVRTRAEEADMDMSPERGNMFYPPDHPAFVAWMRSHKDWASDMLAQAAPPEKRQRKMLKAERAAFESDLVRVRQ